MWFSAEIEINKMDCIESNKYEREVENSLHKLVTFFFFFYWDLEF